MARLKWLTVYTLLVLGSSELSGDDQQNSRQFNVNPNNMMGGMMNPMRNMFGGSGRNQGGYNDYYNTPYYAPQAYPGYPQGYPYPSGNYGQPPMGYGAPTAQYPVNPGYQQPTQQASPTPSYTEQPAQNYQSAPTSRSTTQYRSAPQEQFQFRPMDQQPAEQNSTGSLNMPYQQSPTPTPQASSGYSSNPPSPQGYQQPPVYRNNSQDPSANYTPYNDAVEPTMKFRPLDQPGYSQ
ncbi:MAG: hypothetical protein ABW157_21815 [Candidatus Thiodiazotropha sp. LLP2]